MNAKLTTDYIIIINKSDFMHYFQGVCGNIPVCPHCGEWNLLADTSCLFCNGEITF